MAKMIYYNEEEMRNVLKEKPMTDLVNNPPH
jgi:hypothetical protein